MYHNHVKSIDTNHHKTTITWTLYTYGYAAAPLHAIMQSIAATARLHTSHYRRFQFRPQQPQTPASLSNQHLPTTMVETHTHIFNAQS